MGRSPCCDKTMVKKGPWSPDEDDLLKRFLTQFGNGGNWISLPKKAGLNRCGKSCRLRWLNYLRPNIKHGDFTEDEDQIIYMLYNIVGSRWSVIASKLPRRTDNDVKNYWNTKLRKKLISGKFKSVPFDGIAKNNYGAQTCVNNTNNNTNCKSQNINVVSSQLNQYQLIMHHKEDDKNIISLEENDEIYNESCVSRPCVTPQVISSQCSGSSTNITSSGVENEFWMDLFAETFDDDNVVVGSSLVEEKINEISSLLHVFVD